MKYIALASAIWAVSFSANAQTFDASTPAPTEASPAQVSQPLQPAGTSRSIAGEFIAKRETAWRYGSDLIGEDVYAVSGDLIGPVWDILLDDLGQVRAVIVEISAFAGLGDETFLAVPITAFRLPITSRSQIAVADETALGVSRSGADGAAGNSAGRLGTSGVTGSSSNALGDTAAQSRRSAERAPVPGSDPSSTRETAGEQSRIILEITRAQALAAPKYQDEDVRGSTVDEPGRHPANDGGHAPGSR